MPTTPSTADRSAARRGFTLTELMVVTTIIGVMAAMAVPSFQRAIEQAQADIAVANLRAIWAAERLYWLEPRDYADAYPTLKNRYTHDLNDLKNLGLLDPEIADGVESRYSYFANYDPRSPSTFTATADSTNGLGFFRIDQNGSVDHLNSAISPGFE